MEAILLSAWVSLLVFSALGYAAGWVATRIVEDAVRARIAAQDGAESSGTTVKAS